MKVFYSKRVSDSVSDNPKSKIANPKWSVLVALAVAFAMCGVVAHAQQPAKIPKIGWLETRPATGETVAERGNLATRRKLPDLSYVEGKNIAADDRSAQDNINRLSVLAEELVRLNLDVLVASSTAEALALKNATRTIPIVFVVPSDPVADGLVESLARPGGNLTGITTLAPLLAGKRLELLKEIFPKLSRVAALWNPQDPGSAQQWKESQFSARELGLQLHSMAVSSADKYEGAFKEAAKVGSAALAVTSSLSYDSYRKRIAALAARYRLPAIYPGGDFVESGGLMSYGPDLTEPFRRAASIVDKILKGAKPADIPVEQATKFELVINLKAARALGLTIPQGVLTRAQKVIK